MKYLFVLAALPLVPLNTSEATEDAATKLSPYSRHVRACLDTLMEHGTDTYGEIHTPMLVSILDTRTLHCPRDPAALDEAFRVTRRARRNPAAADLEVDQALLKTMVLFSAFTGNPEYAECARRYAGYVMAHLVDDKGFFWWGWHRRYDVYEDTTQGHNGDHHELHAIHEINWDHLWSINPEAVGREIEAIWQWHVIDKQTGEINRHGDGRRGCDFSMSAGAFIEAFAFMYDETGDEKWLARALLLANYYWDRRNPETDLFPERPNAGKQRFDGSSFVTAIPGLFCHSLLKAWRLSEEETFREQAVAYLKAYAKHGYDSETGKFWGALHLDGTSVPGPRTPDGYAQYEPRGHLELWEPYVAGYQYPIYTAQAYAYGYQLTGEARLLTAAKRFATWIDRAPPGSSEGNERSWYYPYVSGPGKQGAHAGKYGRSISFFLNLFLVTGNHAHLDSARRLADIAVEKLWHNSLFRGHPAKPYYESIDGVGYLLYALLQLDSVLQCPAGVLENGTLTLDGGGDGGRVGMSMENW